MTTVLQIEGLQITAGLEATMPFRLDVGELTLPRGACLAVAGPSGCGKSTLLEVIALFRRPQCAGCFQLTPDVDAAPIDLRGPQDRTILRQGPIGYVPQMGGVLPFLTARAHIAASLHLAGVAGSSGARARLVRLAQALDLTDHLDKRRAALSGGQRKRVALLAGLSVPRALLIADEPTAGLDAQNAARVMRTLVMIAKDESSAVIIATHDTDAAAKAGFDLTEIAQGRLAWHGMRVQGSLHV